MGTNHHKERKKPSFRRLVSHEIFLLLTILGAIGFVLYNLWYLWDSLRIPLGQ